MAASPQVEQETEPCRLYLISPPSINLDSFKIQLTEAFDGGDVAAFQLRLKDVPDAAILQAGKQLLPLCRERGIPFILNDRIDLALELGADGVHLGIDDGDKVQKVAKAREALGDDAVIGVSCYDSRDLAMEAGEQGADYVSFGAFFPSPTKESRGEPNPDILEIWSTFTTVPCVAIGGVTAENAGILVNHGADFLAVISAVWNNDAGAKEAVKVLNQAIDRK